MWFGYYICVRFVYMGNIWVPQNPPTHLVFICNKKKVSSNYFYLTHLWQTFLGKKKWKGLPPSSPPLARLLIWTYPAIPLLRYNHFKKKKSVFNFDSLWHRQQKNLGSPSPVCGNRLKSPEPQREFFLSFVWKINNILNCLNITSSESSIITSFRNRNLRLHFGKKNHLELGTR